jgi:DNA-binding NtrC family response regulator
MVKVLVIDNERGVRNTLKEMLEYEGYRVDAKAIEELKKLDWRGNIRELRNVVERLIILSEKEITLDDVKTYALGIV